jgi:hypothetical protein
MRWSPMCRPRSSTNTTTCWYGALVGLGCVWLGDLGGAWRSLSLLSKKQYI